MSNLLNLKRTLCRLKRRDREEVHAYLLHLQWRVEARKERAPTRQRTLAARIKAVGAGHGVSAAMMDARIRHP
jgi:hypothetical protein